MIKTVQRIVVSCAHCGHELVNTVKDGDVYILQSCGGCHEFSTIEAPEGMFLPDAVADGLIEVHRASGEEADWARIKAKASAIDRLHGKEAN